MTAPRGALGRPRQIPPAERRSRFGPRAPDAVSCRVGRFSTLVRSAIAAALVTLGLFGVADARPRAAPKLRTPRVEFHPEWASHPAAKYAALDAQSCHAELGRRGVAFTEVAKAPGVLAPVRLAKDVGGVVYRTEAPEHQRRQSPFEVFDCRLVLALSDFSKILVAHDIDEVVMFSAWRPPSRRWPEGKLGTRHPGALAIDASRFGKRLREGETTRAWLDVEHDFHGEIGLLPCGPDARPPSEDVAPARELRAIVCDAVDRHLFTSVLTPNYNRAHFNHFHLEVTPEVKWSLVR